MHLVRPHLLPARHCAPLLPTARHWNCPAPLLAHPVLVVPCPPPPPPPPPPAWARREGGGARMQHAGAAPCCRLVCQCWACVTNAHHLTPSSHQQPVWLDTATPARPPDFAPAVCEHPIPHTSGMHPPAATPPAECHRQLWAGGAGAEGAVRRAVRVLLACHDGILERPHARGEGQLVSGPAGRRACRLACGEVH